MQAEALFKRCLHVFKDFEMDKANFDEFFQTIFGAHRWFKLIRALRLIWRYYAA